MKMERGTDIATKKALLIPMKNINTRVTRMNPIMMVLFSSSRVLRVNFD